MRDSPSLSNITFSIERGEFVIITGASGSGKSTLAYSILGLIPFFYSGKSNGKIQFNEEEISKKDLAIHCRSIGYVSQRINNSFATPYVFSELAFPLEYSNDQTKEIGKTIVEHSTKLNIDGFIPRKIQSLSEGEKQLISFASATINGIELIVADEPLANLDRKNKQIVLEKLDDFHKSGKTLIITTHDYKTYLKNASRIIALQHGKIEKNNILGKQVSSNIKRNKVKKPTQSNTHQRKALTNVLEVNNVSFTYSNQFSMDKISFTVGEGQILGIIGDNGSGKTTLLKILCGLISPKKGEIKVQGEPIGNLSWEEITEKFGVVLQDPDKQFFESSVEEEISLISKNLGKYDTPQDISEILKKCKMEGYEKYSPQSLSFGEKRRLAFLSAIQHKPDIILVDEITVGMDNENKQWFLEEVRMLKELGKTIVLVTHDLSSLIEMADSVIHLEKGFLSSIMNPNQYFEYLTKQGFLTEEG